jgi:hypothetical protein
MILKNIEAADEVILALLDILDNSVVHGNYRGRAIRAIEAATGLKYNKDAVRQCPWDKKEQNANHKPD